MNSKLSLLCMLLSLSLYSKAQLDTLQIDNYKRTYKLYIPANYEGTKKVPLLLCFHGWYQNATTMESIIGFSKIADTAGFCVAYFNYVGPPPDYSWNYNKLSDKPDEIKFVTTALDSIKSKCLIDTTRIYAIGFSDGSGMPYCLAVTFPGMLAGIASSSSAATFEGMPDKMLPEIIHFHAEDDGSWNTTLPKILFWNNLNHGSTDPDTIFACPEITISKYKGAEGYSSIITCIRKIGGHQWFKNESFIIWRYFLTGKIIYQCTTTSVSGMDVSNNFIECYPNPFDKKLNIAIPIKDPGPIEIGIFNSGGIQVNKVTLQALSEGKNQIALSSGLFGKSGLYYLKIETCDAIHYKKIVLK
jgi:predicted esterase